MSILLKEHTVPAYYTACYNHLMHAIDKAIVQTLCYADIFDYPLTAKEIYTKLIYSQSITPSCFKNHLDSLHKNGIICRTSSYFHLPKRAELISLRKQRQKFSTPKKVLAQKLAKQLILLPYIKAVFLTGAVAVGNATKEDDIDVMIVTSAGHLWTGRLLITLWLELIRKRRHPQSKKFENLICPNLFVTTSALQVPLNQQNLYTAHEVVQTQPLADPHQLLPHFRQENSWVTAYLINSPQHFPNQTLNRSAASYGRVESFLENIQVSYMNSKRTREIIYPDKAYFHPRDTAGIVLQRFSNKCHQLHI